MVTALISHLITMLSGVRHLSGGGRGRRHPPDWPNWRRRQTGQTGGGARLAGPARLARLPSDTQQYFCVLACFPASVQPVPVGVRLMQTQADTDDTEDRKRVHARKHAIKLETQRTDTKETRPPARYEPTQHTEKHP